MKAYDPIKEQKLAVLRMEYGKEADSIIEEFTGIKPVDHWCFHQQVKNAIVVLLDKGKCDQPEDSKVG